MPQVRALEAGQIVSSAVRKRWLDVNMGFDALVTIAASLGLGLLLVVTTWMNREVKRSGRIKITDAIDPSRSFLPRLRSGINERKLAPNIISVSMVAT